MNGQYDVSAVERLVKKLAAEGYTHNDLDRLVSANYLQLLKKSFEEVPLLLNIKKNFTFSTLEEVSECKISTSFRKESAQRKIVLLRGTNQFMKAFGGLPPQARGVHFISCFQTLVPHYTDRQGLADIGGEIKADVTPRQIISLLNEQSRGKEFYFRSGENNQLSILYHVFYVHDVQKRIRTVLMNRQNAVWNFDVVPRYVELELPVGSLLYARTENVSLS